MNVLAGAPLRIALGEYDTGWHDPAASVARASELIQRAAAARARIVVLPEMCASGFTMNAETYAEPIDGRSVKALASAARSAGVYVVAGIATREKSGGAETFHNSALLFAPDGSRVAEYRKQRLFTYASEDRTYTAGSVPTLVEIDGRRFALFICFDLRFPELFRQVAPAVDCIILIANWPSERQSHWETLLRARAIECQAFVIGVNRRGRGGDLDYAGGSVAFDPWGEQLASAGDPKIVEVDEKVVTSARRKFPLIRDERRGPM